MGSSLLPMREAREDEAFGSISIGFSSQLPGAVWIEQMSESKRNITRDKKRFVLAIDWVKLTTAVLYVATSVLTGCSTTPASRYRPGHLIVPKGLLEAQDRDSIQQIDWSPNGALSFIAGPVTDGRSPKLYIKFSNQQPNLIGTACNNFGGWDSTGRYALYSELALPEFSPVGSEGIKIYDRFQSKSTTIPGSIDLRGRNVWVDDDTIEIAKNIVAQDHVYCQLHMHSLTGKDQLVATLPADVIPSTPLYHDWTSHSLLMDCYVDTIVSGKAIGANYLYMVNGGHATPIASSGGNNGVIAFCPLSRKLAYGVNKRNGDLDHVDEIDLTQNSPARALLTTSSLFPPHTGVRNVSYSPDGNSLLFTTKDPAGKSAIYLYTKQDHRLTKVADGSLGTFSPDGKQIAYAVLGFNEQYLPSQVYICQLDGSNASRIF